MEKDGSAAKAYLVPSLDRDNLTIFTDTCVNKINISNGKATGVLCIDDEGNEFEIHASKECLIIFRCIWFASNIAKVWHRS